MSENIITIEPQVEQTIALNRVYEAYLHRNRRKNRRLTALAQPVQIIQTTAVHESHLKTVLNNTGTKAGRIIIADFTQILSD